MFSMHSIFISIWNTHCSSHVVYRYKSVAMEDTQVRQVSAVPPSDSEEQRKIAEGADALLNLAGISTRKRVQSTALYPPGKFKEICSKYHFLAFRKLLGFTENWWVYANKFCVLQTGNCFCCSLKKYSNMAI
jgi:hypothetical protein